MLKALLIGINYTNTRNPLQGCVNDIVNMKKMLMDHYEFKEENLTMLSDDEQSKEKPTRNNIISHIDRFVKGVKAGDVLVFHYSGHGIQVKDYDRDEKTGLDDAIVPIDYDTNGVITDDIIYRHLISCIPSGAKLVAFLDCCHSGSICDLKYNIKYVGPYMASENIDVWMNNYVSWEENKNIAKGDIYMFSGCYDEQTSADASINYIRQGAFTFVLRQVLQDSNYDITYKQLLKHVNARLSLSSFEQRSQFSCSKQGLEDETFKLGKN